MSWEVRNRSGAVLSTHTTEDGARRRVERDQARTARQLNRPGLHGGISAERFCERYIVNVGAAGEPTEAGQERHNPLPLTADRTPEVAEHNTQERSE